MGEVFDFIHRILFLESSSINLYISNEDISGTFALGSVSVTTLYVPHNLFKPGDHLLDLSSVVGTYKLQ